MYLSVDEFTQINVPVKLEMSTVTEDDTRRLIELRAANEVLFTGRRNTAKPAWRSGMSTLTLTSLTETRGPITNITGLFYYVVFN